MALRCFAIAGDNGLSRMSESGRAQPSGPPRAIVRNRKYNQHQDMSRTGDYRGQPAPRAIIADDAGVAGSGQDTILSQPSAAESAVPSVAPEDYSIPQGRLSPVDHNSTAAPSDIFRCTGCVDPACQSAFGCASMPWRLQPGGYLREILTAKVYDVADETPMQRAKGLSASLGNTILLKREDLQPVKSFKLRGAYNKMAQLSPEQLERGVICSSAGNHAQGVALSASRLGCSAIICMPTTTPDIKVAAVRALGGTVELVGESYQETQSHAQARAAAEGRVFIPPYDDPYVIAGQGTIAAEILRQCDMSSLDAIFVAIGGGGMVAGVAAYVKSLKPEIKVIGVEPVGANAMAQSLARGERVALSKVDVFADGVAVKYVGAECFRICRELLDGVVLVDNAAISTAIKDVFNETRSILEPSGAVAVAGAKAYLKHYNLQGQNVVAITSGANMNFERLRQVADLAGAGEAESMLAVSLPEQPGSFLDFVVTALHGDTIDVTEFKYRYSAGRKAAVLLGVGVAPGSKDCKELVERLAARGYPAVDMTDLELAQTHLRHLVGGHGGHGNGAGIPLQHERIFQVDFLERPGSLRRFLALVSPRWSLSLFHYRRTGNRASGVLLGLVMPPEDEEEFNVVVKKLEGMQFTMTEIGKREKEVVKLFLQ